MSSKRLTKKYKVVGTKVCAPSSAGEVRVSGVIQACKNDPAGNNLYTIMLDDGSLREYAEEEIICIDVKVSGKGKSGYNQKMLLNCKGSDSVAAFQEREKNDVPLRSPEPRGLTAKKPEDRYLENKCNRTREVEKEHSTLPLGSVSEQKRLLPSANIDVPQRKPSEEADMDEVMAAAVLTSLSTSPLVRSPPSGTHTLDNCKVSKEGPTLSASYGSSTTSGNWSWDIPSDHSNPSTPSPPLPADSSKPLTGQLDDGIDEPEASHFLFEEPAPRKRKNSMKVMFKCLWKNCGKVLSTSSGIQKHVRTLHLGHNGDSDHCDGEEDFYYSEIDVDVDSLTDGLSSLTPMSPTTTMPPVFPNVDSGCSDPTLGKCEEKLVTPLSQSAPTNLYHVRTDHAYQATAPVSIPLSSKFMPNGTGFSISLQSPPVIFKGSQDPLAQIRPISIVEKRQISHPSLKVHTSLVSSPKPGTGTRKPRGEGKKCRKVYGMENRDMWCTACRWKKACQRFVD
ncbi:zinc finger protein 704-like isoform X2 [Rhincodon typus]|uniref:zinc finger protein 704-like isoform X2 n=2 Tax=Rhincodon typus TaxID=259920 RepID=UPI00202DE70A|nr:zinc finger protein 704-like isoform X2 [Rhincodon typus]